MQIKSLVSATALSAFAALAMSAAPAAAAPAAASTAAPGKANTNKVVKRHARKTTARMAPKAKQASENSARIGVEAPLDADPTRSRDARRVPPHSLAKQRRRRVRVDVPTRKTCNSHDRPRRGGFPSSGEQPALPRQRRHPGQRPRHGDQHV